jgi:hypothetical protein
MKDERWQFSLRPQFACLLRDLAGKCDPYKVFVNNDLSDFAGQIERQAREQAKRRTSSAPHQSAPIADVPQMRKGRSDEKTTDSTCRADAGMHG